MYKIWQSELHDKWNKYYYRYKQRCFITNDGMNKYKSKH